MLLQKNKFYILLSALVTIGYTWVCYQIYFPKDEALIHGSCLFKNITTIPCPSCGVTRSVIAITEGHFMEAFSLNPIGFIVASIMVLLPLLLVYDLLKRRQLLLQLYHLVEDKIRQPKMTAVLLTLVLSNWIWNIYKGL